MVSSLFVPDCTIAELPSVPLVLAPETSSIDQQASDCVCPPKSIVTAPDVGLAPRALNKVILFLDAEVVS